MLTYKIWESYIDNYWYKLEPLDYSEVLENVFAGFMNVLCSVITICLDIIAIPFYIIAFIIWFMRGCE